MHQVLIVDDNLGVRETFGAALRLEGYAVLEADTGRRATECLAAHSPSAMLLDFRLPDMPGLDVLRWMRSANRFVPSAIVTAFIGDFDPDDALALGALAYADQPLSSDRLIATVSALVRPPTAHDDPDVLHRRVLAGDPAALDALAEICLRELPRRLERAFPREPWDLVVDAVSQACLSYGSGVRRVPNRPPVLNFLYGIAWRRLENRRKADQARAARERRWAAEQPTITAMDGVGASLDAWEAIIAVVKDVRERRGVELWLDGAPTGVIAAALGAAHLSVPEERRVVKQFKDRIIKRLSRYLRGDLF